MRCGCEGPDRPARATTTDRVHLRRHQNPTRRQAGSGTPSAGKFKVAILESDFRRTEATGNPSRRQEDRDILRAVAIRRQAEMTTTPASRPGHKVGTVRAPPLAVAEHGIGCTSGVDAGQDGYAVLRRNPAPAPRRYFRDLRVCCEGGCTRRRRRNGTHGTLYKLARRPRRSRPFRWQSPPRRRPSEIPCPVPGCG